MSKDLLDVFVKSDNTGVVVAIAIGRILNSDYLGYWPGMSLILA